MYDGLERTIQTFHHHQTLSKHAEVAQIVEYVLNQLNDLNERARLLNTREGYFEREQTDYSKLQTMARDF